MGFKPGLQPALVVRLVQKPGQQRCDVVIGQSLGIRNELFENRATNNQPLSPALALQVFDLLFGLLRLPISLVLLLQGSFLHCKQFFHLGIHQFILLSCYCVQENGQRLCRSFT